MSSLMTDQKRAPFLIGAPPCHPPHLSQIPNLEAVLHLLHLSPSHASTGCCICSLEKALLQCLTGAELQLGLIPPQAGPLMGPSQVGWLGFHHAGLSRL